MIIDAGLQENLESFLVLNLRLCVYYVPTELAVCGAAADKVDELSCCTVVCDEDTSNCCDLLTSGSSCDDPTVTYPCLLAQWGDVGMILDISSEWKER